MLFTSKTLAHVDAGWGGVFVNIEVPFSVKEKQSHVDDRDLKASEFYGVADSLFARRSRTSLPTQFQCCTGLIKPSAPFATSSGKRLELIQDFFDRSLEIFEDALRGKCPHDLYQWLLNDTPASLRRRWHLSLPRAVYKRPLFFRTDECPEGKIMELQCPGSGWGDLAFLRELYLEFGGMTEAEREKLRGFDPAGTFVAEVARSVGRTAPSILHLLDNASGPSSVKYFITATSPPLRYWGYDSGIENKGCELIRSHSFFGLVAENLFKVRLERAAKGETQFDLPPIVVFDQKTPLALPFMEATRERFSDEVRSIFVYTAPLTRDGFQDEQGQQVSFDALLKRPLKDRKYFAKYAGVDVSRNWGSRAVHRLSDNKKTLEAIRADVESGMPWIVQPDVSGKASISFFNREKDQIQKEKLYAAYSRFYGPSTIIGARARYRGTVKVHGQPDTAAGLVL